MDLCTVGLDNLVTKVENVPKGAYGLIGVCGLLDEESFHLEYGIQTDCNGVCWIQVFTDCGDPVILDNTHQPKVFGKDYPGLFRWVADTPMNENVKPYSSIVTSGGE